MSTTGGFATEAVKLRFPSDGKAQNKVLCLIVSTSVYVPSRSDLSFQKQMLARHGASVTSARYLPSALFSHRSLASQIRFLWPSSTTG
jgi:hypothetical protein